MRHEKWIDEIIMASPDERGAKAHTRAAYDKKLYLYLLKILEKLEETKMVAFTSISRPKC